MTKTVDKSGFTSGNPSRQGFYKVRTTSGRVLIAEWRELDKKIGKSWYEHIGESPTAEKVPTLVVDVQGYMAASKDEIASALHREQTVPEKIQKAYESYCRTVGIYRERRTDHPPACRQLSIGDEVYLGALIDCKVVGLFDEGRTVVISHRDRKRVYGKEVDNGTAYMAIAWTDVTKVGDSAEDSIAVEPLMWGGYTNSTVDSLMSMYAQGLADSPDYQRGYVWTDEDKQRYLSSLVEGRELGRFIFVRYGYPREDEVLDGKQRLNCLWQFFTSQIAYKGRFWHELSRKDRSLIEVRSVQWATLPGSSYTRADLLKIFLEVNAAGVPQTEEHLAKVRALLAQEEAKATA